jgi:hypothetical protein
VRSLYCKISCSAINVRLHKGGGRRSGNATVWLDFLPHLDSDGGSEI